MSAREEYSKQFAGLISGLNSRELRLFWVFARYAVILITAAKLQDTLAPKGGKRD